MEATSKTFIKIDPLMDRLDAPSVLISKLIPATLVHGWVKGTLFRGVGFFDSLTGPC